MLLYGTRLKGDSAPMAPGQTGSPSVQDIRPPSASAAPPGGPSGLKDRTGTGSRGAFGSGALASQGSLVTSSEGTAGACSGQAETPQ